MRSAVVIVLVLLGFGVTWSLIPLIRRFLAPSFRRQLHQTHDAPVSRFGGLALAAAFLVLAIVALIFFQGREDRLYEWCVILASALVMFLLGFWDDIRPLGAKKKLVGQIIIASAVYFCGIQIGTFRNPLTGTDYILGGWSYVATVFWLVAFTNLVNLIDGVDGLAAGISFMVMALLVYVGLNSVFLFPTVCAMGMCGALLGFLYYNFPPAKIYLGDGGAYFLGFLIGILSMIHSHKGTVAAALIAPLFVLALPILDVGLAILRRGLKGMPIFRPDKRHIHHRLSDTGLSRTKVVLIFYGCSLFFLLLAFGVFASRGTWVPILFGVGCLALLASARSFKFSREWFAVGRVLGNSREVRKLTRYALAMTRWLELEAERSASAEDLWDDFGFLCRKLGFADAILTTPEGRKVWTGPMDGPRSGAMHRRRFELPPAIDLEITAPADKFGSDAFELLSDLAAETWLKVNERWQEVNHIRLAFRPELAEENSGVPANSAGASPRTEANWPAEPGVISRPWPTVPAQQG